MSFDRKLERSNGSTLGDSVHIEVSEDRLAKLYGGFGLLRRPSAKRSEKVERCSLYGRGYPKTQRELSV